jgi:hypothetical protein
MQSQSYPIPIKVYLDASVIGFETNQFIHNLKYGGNNPFDYDEIWEVIKLYRLATMQGGNLSRGTIYPYWDERQQIRAMQVSTYDDCNYEAAVDWLHSLLTKEYKREQKPVPEWVNNYQANKSKLSCLFGAHLVKEYPDNPIAITTSPQAAIYGTLYFGIPKDKKDMVWMSAYRNGEIDTLNAERCQILKGRTIYLFPDLFCYNEWQAKAKKIMAEVQGVRVIVSDFIEKLRKPDDIEKGFRDLSDYLRVYDWRSFRKG